MKRYLFSLLLWGAVAAANSQTHTIGLVPMPVSIQTGTGYFNLDSTVHIVPGNHKLLFETMFIPFREILSSKRILNQVDLFTKEPGNLKNKFGYILLNTDSSLTNKDEYRMIVSTDKIVISGRENGVYYGMVTLFQLVNIYINDKRLARIPCMEIYDYPRFAWRGMHLDCSRHFFPVTFIKKYIDVLALYKMSVFHWHLTDDQGWRIEIKKYPRLTQVAAWRKGSQIGKYAEQKFDSVLYGGYYKQEEIQEIVNYASQRHITVVPEIEMPGHSLAALAAYPELGCKDSTLQVAKGWGVFDDVYCPKEETFQFLKDVLTEVMELFPSTYIHIGGDECPKTRWKESAYCQQQMKREGLKDEHELQSYFIRRIERFVNSNGRQIIGWDEILEGGLAPNAAVMSWRGEAGGIAAAKQRHYVVMSPGSHCYFDHYQYKPDSLEPIAIGGFTPVEKVYNYNPVPDTLSDDEKKYIMGAQGNVWTEYILTPEQVEYMALPRMCALAEVLWTAPTERNFENFKTRLKQHLPLLDKVKVNYARHLLSQP